MNSDSDPKPKRDPSPTRRGAGEAVAVAAAAAAAVTAITATYTPIRGKAPVLEGWFPQWAVAQVAWALPAVSARIWADAGMTALRGLDLREDASLYPLVPPSHDALDAAKARPVSVADFAALPVPASRPASAEHPFRHWTIRDYHAQYAAGAVTPTDVARTLLAAIAASNAYSPPLRAFIVVDDALVLAAAAESTARWKAGAPKSVLDGVPVAVKDELDVKGLTPAMFGTDFFNADIDKAAHDSFCVARLRDAGALLVGKTNMAELGLDVITCNPIGRCGVARNPHDLDRHTGGSSGGSAAAVAAGFVPLAVGADGGGSVRIPASYCGVWGLKPTWSRVSGAPTPCLDPSTGHIGPLGASLEDVAIGYAVMAGHDPTVPLSLLQPLPSLPSYLATATSSGAAAPTPLKGLRLGYYGDYFRDADLDVVTVCQAVLDALVAQCGAELVDIVIPDLHLIRTGHVMSITSEIFSLVRHRYPTKIGRLGLPTQLLCHAQAAAKVDDYLTAQRMRTRTLDVLRDTIFAHADVIVLPMTPFSAPPITPGSVAHGISDAAGTINGMRFATLGNFSGLPALSCPVGVDAATGCPIGFQILGRWWDEDTVLRVGAAVARVAGTAAGAGPRPSGMFFDVLGNAIKAAAGGE
ncbi:hypothetical protein H9P43_010042 [Blastocladiella emersonii ATCC 22665]|nr:hypothetical protein H9P43_010042 [Blastocladiella emersonii ATCC 22665]